MSSPSDDDKVIPFPGRHAARTPVPVLPGIGPDAVYVFKLGPLETQEGRHFLYVPLQGNGTPHMPELAENDAGGMARLASLFQGRRLYCEPRLARAGAPYGFVSRSVPPELSLVRALMALSTEWELLSSGTPPGILPPLLEAASTLWEAHPWELWTNIEVLELSLEGPDPLWREVCVLGNGGEEFGFALYRQPGSVERLGRLTEEERIQASLEMESLALLFEEEPAWVRTEVRRVTGLPVFPVPMYLSPGGFAPLRQEDLMVLLAVTRALARLSPEQLEPREEVSWEGLRVTAHVRAHVPLFTGLIPPPATSRSAGSAGPGTPLPPPLPPLPRHTISQRLISFVQPLVPEPEDVEPNMFMMMLELAITTWNAVVLDTWEPGRDRVGATRAAVQSLPRDMHEWMLPLFEALVEHKRSRGFQEDLRLMGGLQVRWGVDGEPHIRLQWRLPGT